MFTGIVQAVGRIERVERQSGGMRLTVGAVLPGAALALGESVAVDGACLTVSAAVPGGFAADVSEETVSRTTLGDCRPGTRVNLERALTLTDRLGGHIVTGHVDGLGTLRERRAAGNSWTYSIDSPPALREYIAEKGSIAVDGVSLTVSSLSASGFTAAVIPHTEAATTLGAKLPGSRVNLEVDILARYVKRILSAGNLESNDRRGLGGLLEEFLA